MAIWTTPDNDDWDTGTLVTAELMQEQILENLRFLKDPPTGRFIGSRDEDVLAETDNTDFNSVFDGAGPGGAESKIDLTTYGGDVLLLFVGRVKADGTNVGSTTLKMDFKIDGERVGESILDGEGPTGKGLFAAELAPSEIVTVVMPWLATALTSGEHTFRVQWASSNGSVKIQKSTPFQFIVRELS